MFHSWLHVQTANTVSLFAVCAIAGILIAFCSSKLQFLRRTFQDSVRLRQSLQALLTTQTSPPRIAFDTEEACSTWQLVLALAQRARAVDSTASTYSDALTLGQRIVGSVSEPALTAATVAQVLLEKTRPEVLGVAIVLRSENDGELQLASSAGLPRSRIAELLLIEFDELLHNQPTHAWGYRVSNRGEVSDLSAFGVSTSLRVPIKQNENIVGGIWLGFKSGAVALSTERRAFVQAIVEHAAASLHAAYFVREQQQQSDSERDFLLGLSHDLRAPGNSALYAVQDLLLDERGSLAPDQRTQLAEIERAIREQLTSIEDVLDLTKHERGLLTAITQSVNARACLLGIVRETQRSAKERGLTLTIEAPDELLAVRCDPRHLKRIITNFVSNAIKYSDRGEIVLSISSNGAHAEFTVTDSGVGIPVEDETMLFSQFTRLKNALSRPGTGLGLALSRTLAEMNSGSVFYRANPHGGSIFGLRLEADVTPVVVPKFKNHFPFQTVLIVDHDPAVCRSHARFLKNHCQNIQIAYSVSEACKDIETRRPNLIITDLMFPEGSVEGILAAAEQTDENCPVLIVTGDEQAASRLIVTYRIPIQVLAKPLDREKLLASVGSFHERSEVNQRLAANA